MKTYQEVLKSLERNQYTWLITGVAGFIGSNLLEKLLTLDQKVIGLDNFETGYQSNIDEAIGAIYFLLMFVKRHVKKLILFFTKLHSDLSQGQSKIQLKPTKLMLMVF